VYSKDVASDFASECMLSKFSGISRKPHHFGGAKAYHDLSPAETLMPNIYEFIFTSTAISI
jgi:hypothetical protein